MAEIITAIDVYFHNYDPTAVQPFLNDQKGPGNFVSNLLAYHVAWYREWWGTANNDPSLACLRSGHTHVGGQITVGDAAQALDVQLTELFKVLPAT